jgi:hypothetical protein
MLAGYWGQAGSCPTAPLAQRGLPAGVPGRSFLVVVKFHLKRRAGAFRADFSFLTIVSITSKVGTRKLVAQPPNTRRANSLSPVSPASTAFNTRSGWIVNVSWSSLQRAKADKDFVANLKAAKAYSD